MYKLAVIVPSRIVLKTNSNAFKHGLRDTPEYMAWAHMKDRCYNHNCKNYADYGGRGITVCNEWLNSFDNFISDIRFKLSLLYTLDRIDVDGNYNKMNCRWATREQQSINRRKFRNNTSGITGVSRDKTKKGWVAYIHNKNKRIHLGSFSNIIGAASARKKAELLYGR